MSDSVRRTLLIRGTTTSGPSPSVACRPRPWVSLVSWSVRRRAAAGVLRPQMPLGTSSGTSTASTWPVFKLDGKNDYIKAPVSLGLEFTVTFWLKTETSMGDMNTSDWNSPVGLFTGTPFTHAAFLAKGKLMFWSSGHGYRKSTSIFVNNGSWFHVACSRSDQNHMKKGHFLLYLNGLAPLC